jgi:hypothetical protein
LGLPDWVVYPNGASEHTETKKERKARDTGDTKDLLSAGRAVDLLRQDLERLTYYLDRLPGLKEQLQAERFVSSFWVGEHWEYLPKSEFSEEGWKELCESYGEDPNVKELRFSIDPIKPQGASAAPWESFIPLIALHRRADIRAYQEGTSFLGGTVFR